MESQTELPGPEIERLRELRRSLTTNLPRTGETDEARRIRESKVVFAAADHFLDRAAYGPIHLKDHNAARILENAILFGAGEALQSFRLVRHGESRARSALALVGGGALPVSRRMTVVLGAAPPRVACG